MKSYKQRLILINVIVILFGFTISLLIQNRESILGHRQYVENQYKNHVMLIKEIIDEKIVQSSGLDVPADNFAYTQFNKELFQPFFMDFTDDSEVIWKIHNRVNRMLGQYYFLKGIDIYYEKSDILFLSGHVKNLKEDRNSSLKTEIDWMGENGGEWLPNRYYEPLLENVITYVVDYNNKGKIAVHINEAFFTDYLMNNFKFTDTGILTIINSNNQPVAGSKELFNRFNLVHWALDKDYGMMQVYDNQHKEYTLFYHKSGLNDWVYTYGIPTDDMYSIGNFMWKNIAIMLLIIVACITASIILNRKVSSPIGRIFHTIQNLPIQDKVEGKNDVEYIEERLSTMIHQYGEIYEELDKNKSIIFHSIIKKILRGSLSLESAIKDNWVVDAFRTRSCTFALVCQLKNDNMSMEEEVVQPFTLLGKLEKYHEHYHMLLIAEDNRIEGIINYDDQFIKKENIIQYIVDSTGNDAVTCIGIGSSDHLSSNNITASYKEAKEALKYHFIMSAKKSIYYEQEAFDQYKRSSSSHEAIQQMEKAIYGKNEDAALLTVNGILESLTIGKYEIECCKNTIQDVCSTARRAFKKCNVLVDEVLGYDMRKHYKNYEDIYHLRQWMNKMLIQLFDELQGSESKEDQLMRKNIRTIIDEHLLEDLTLQLIADKIGLRYDMLSRNFKRIMGKSFIAYVTDLKLKKATSLLCEKRYTVNEIARILGYNTTHHFIKLFKEKYEDTPKRYQKKMLDQQRGE